MQKTFRTKFIVLIHIFLFLFLIRNFAYGVDYNDDIQKVTLDYYYYEGFGKDKVVQRVKDGSWHILKPDGSVINLKGNYMDYAGIEKGKYYYFNEDYYRFVVANKDNSIRFVFVSKNGIECLVDGYSFADPTISDKYWLLMNVDSDMNYKFGLYDKYSKREVIPVIYDSLLYLDDDRIVVRNDEKEGIIDINQKLITPFEYNFLQYINDNFIIALDRNKHGVININNEVVLPFEYDEIHKVSETDDYCRIIKNNKFGLVNGDNSELVIPIEYESLYYVDEMCIGNNLILAQKDGKTGIIDVNNKEVVPFIYEGIELIGNYFEVYNDGLSGLLDSEGNEIFPTEFIDIMEIKDGFVTARVYIDDYEYKYAVYDMKGNEIVPPVYDYIDYHASEKYMIVKNNEGAAKLVEKATVEVVLTNNYYSDIIYINDKYFAGGNNSRYSIINFSGQHLTLPYYSNVYLVNVEGEEFLAAQRHTSEKFKRRIDYFKQTEGPSQWAVEEVSKAIENNLVPFEYQVAFTFNIKRYEFCKIIVSFLEEYYNTTRDDIIMDNNIDVVNPPIVDGFNEDVAICLHLGIVSGRGKGIFDGESEITREEAAVMLTNLVKYLGMYEDAEGVYLNDKSELSSWSKDSVKFVMRNGIIHGVGNNMFSPKSNLTREQTYIIMYRMLHKMELKS